ncbi:hypothetical protein [Microbacterium sp. NPDC089696]
MDAIPDAEKLRELLAAEGGADVALIEVEGRAPFYVGLNDDGELVEVHRS